MLNLINPPLEKEIEVEKTAISTAVTEKPLAKRRLATTRRVGQKSTSNKKSLAKTRRHH